MELIKDKQEEKIDTGNNLKHGALERRDIEFTPGREATAYCGVKFFPVRVSKDEEAIKLVTCPDCIIVMRSKNNWRN